MYGESGNTAFTAEAEYELLLTQRLIIQPRAEITFYGKDDEQNELGSGLSSTAIGVRVRYEFTRRICTLCRCRVGLMKLGSAPEIRQAQREERRKRY